MITALCGGVGGSKLVLGLYRTLPPGDLAVIVNTADDEEVYGLHVSPDLDTVMYTLAGIANQEFGWGVEGDTFDAMGMLRSYGEETWFQIGDRDLATNLRRTTRLRSGESLSRITAEMAMRLGVTAGICPATDDAIATQLLVDDSWVPFQDYFVRRGHKDRVEALRYEGVSSAIATPAAVEALSEADIIVLVNSNPALSIVPILSVPGVNDAVAGSGAKRVAVSPIVGSNSVSGPAGNLMSLLGYPSSATGVAQTYLGVIDGIVIDVQDEEQSSRIEELGVRVHVTNTIMQSLEDRDRLAVETVEFARTLR
jgi:LPPG:FO 2-phospho-L-lactate transferase